MTTAYRIREWADRYEVDEKGASARPGKTLRAAPLDYVRWKVNGHIHGPGYRRLIQVSKTPARLEAAVVTFAKLLEIAANQERIYRGWILTDRQEPATTKDLAFYTGFRKQTIEIGLEVLCDPHVFWVEVSEFSGICAEFRGVPRSSAEFPEIPRLNENENETEHEEKQKQNSTETETATSEPDQISRAGFSGSDSLSSSSDSRPPTRDVARVRFQLAIDPLLGVVKGCRHPAGSAQREADVTVMHQWWNDLIWPDDVDVGEGRRRFSLAVGLIRKASGKDRPMAWLTTRLKQELEKAGVA